MKTKLFWFAVSVAFIGAQVAKPGAVDFAADVAPILKGKCVSCHGPEVQSGGLRLDTPAGIQKGGAHGALFAVGKGAESYLIQRILGKGGGPRMPMGFAPLSAQATAKIVAWIDQGAKIPGGELKHWAYVAPKRPTPPVVKTQNWARNEIDRFVLARLEKEGLKPSKPATKEQLARRAALDLTGLPPTVEELDRFLNDKSPTAYEKYVDRLLASSHYGERMARAWLDLARYADTNGYEKDLPRQMWLWRDWVIGAFNKDMPYDEFTVEQIAGDLLPKPTRDQLVATGFHRNSLLNDEGGIDAEEFRVVAVMDRLDATATTWLGTTLACAQCHNHKYDPLSQKDYYRFYAYFNQSEDNGRDMQPTIKVPSPLQDAQIKDLNEKLAAARKDFDAAKAKLDQGQSQKDWEAAQIGSWPIPSVLTATSGATGGASLTVSNRQWILAGGMDPEQDTYVVTMQLQNEVVGLRFEVGPDVSLPQMSSGRNPNGSFVLGHIEAKVLRAAGGEESLKFDSALADYTQEGHDPLSLIRPGDGPGWAVSAYLPEHKIVHAVVLGLEKPYRPVAGDRLVVTIKSHPRFAHHNVGRFRIALTSNPAIARQAPPSAAVLELLSKPTRTPEEQKKVEDFRAMTAPELNAGRMQIRDLEKKLAEIDAKLPTAMVMREATKPRPNRLLTRGDFRTPAEAVVAGTPSALGGVKGREDRMGLAKWLVSPQNPLTARVEVNRLWEQCFGRGLVATPEDFGTQGERPTHPELLDWLATELVARKWSLKAVLRLIVTSATYRQSSFASPALLQRDPYNLLLARGSRFRMEAEGVRDIALVASGRYTPTIGGPSVMPPQPPGIWENSFSFYDTAERWVDDEGPNRYRRGLYTYWRRTAPFPMALTFDTKSRDMCVSHRSRTNTPLQALNMMNDPLFVECAGALGRKMASLGGEKGLVYGFRASTGRMPRPADLVALRKLVAIATARYLKNPAAAAALQKAARSDASATWILVASTVLNLDEVITRG